MLEKMPAINFEVFRTQLETSIDEIKNSIDLSTSHREILLFIYESLLEGINKGKFSRYPKLPVVTLQIRHMIIFVEIRFIYSEQLKSFKNIYEIDGLITLVEYFAQKSGLKSNRIGKKSMESLELYWKV